MKDEKKKIEVLRVIVTGINTIFMFITIALQIWAFQALAHSIRCSLILFLLAVTLVLDGMLKDGKKIAMDGIYYVLWCVNLIWTFFYF